MLLNHYNLENDEASYCDSAHASFKEAVGVNTPSSNAPQISNKYGRKNRRRQEISKEGRKVNLVFLVEFGLMNHHLQSKKTKCIRRSKKDVYLADRISELPDEILAIILSHLTLRAAVNTSVLSPRWKDLWTFTTGSLDFDFGSNVLSLIKDCKLAEILKPERRRYIRWVNKILNAHKGATIDAFRVKFDLRRSAKSDIDRWINFALRKRVQSLELDLMPAHLSQAPLDWNNDVAGDDLEYLLSNCPFLEFIHVLNSPGLVRVNVVAPCPNLKHLEISHSYYLKSIDISSAPNLKSLTYFGPYETKLSLGNVPNLSDLSFGGFYCMYIVGKHRQLPITLGQMEKLRLSLCTQFDWPEGLEEREVQRKEKCIMHKCLKVVELAWFRGSTTDVELVTYVLSTAPFLEKIFVDTRDFNLLQRSQFARKNVSAKKCMRWQAKNLSPAAELLII
ncbi:hypothetical protein LguiB_001819 [Lonicera macranthoides]